MRLDYCRIGRLTQNFQQIVVTYELFGNAEADPRYYLRSYEVLTGLTRKLHDCHDEQRLP
uniref:Uncharacterized protein n=1 Tax=Romanomermis culicivorax TaxID=13658 RepID=A0A915IXU3_ROMCU